VSLPQSASVAGKVELSGGWVEIRGLSITEVRTLSAMEGDASQTDPHWIAAATGTPLAEVQEWWKTALAGDVKRLLGAIWETSGLGEGARFPGRTTDDAGVPPAAE
jgi:hypothetical protein